MTQSTVFSSFLFLLPTNQPNPTQPLYRTGHVGEVGIGVFQPFIPSPYADIPAPTRSMMMFAAALEMSTAKDTSAYE